MLLIRDVPVGVANREQLSRSNLYIFFCPIFVIKEWPLVEEQRAKERPPGDTAGGIRPWLPLARLGFSLERKLMADLHSNLTTDRTGSTVFSESVRLPSCASVTHDVVSD